jgi:hypothetical protein
MIKERHLPLQSKVDLLSIFAKFELLSLFEGRKSAYNAVRLESQAMYVVFNPRKIRCQRAK